LAYSPVIDELSRLPESVRKLALDRFHLLQPLYSRTGCFAPQFYSRIGFVHEFRPLGAPEVRQLLEQHWAPLGVKLHQTSFGPETVAVIIRVTGGNLRLLNRLLTQIQRILEINALEEATKAVLEAARES
jgi:hypothetical protein